MRRIGLTQRVDVVPAYGERRDALDQNWARILEKAGLVPVPLPNGLESPEAWLDALQLDGVILTGGNDLADLPGAAQAAPERDRLERAVLAWADRRPVLGVCRGAQLMARYFGASLSRVERHVAVRHAVRLEDGAPREWPSPLEVNSYHAWGVRTDALPGCLRPTARCDDGTVEAFAHDALRRAGILWHPEREAPFRDFEIRWLSTFFAPAGRD